MTREEHIAAAERFARDNPEWKRVGVSLIHLDASVVRPSVIGHGWLAFRSEERGSLPQYFASPAAAVLALGFSLAPESTDAR